ncbi:MAG: DUF711 family protein [Nitrosopumilus sp.]
MQSNKIIRTVCCFSDNPNTDTIEKINAISKKLTEKNYLVQTKRVCSNNVDVHQLEKAINDKDILLSVGTLDHNLTIKQLEDFYSAREVSFNIDLTSKKIEAKHVRILFDIIKNAPGETFNFTYVFNNRVSSPYFPSASYACNGFAIGLQPTDLSEGCSSLDVWLERIKDAWLEIHTLFKNEPDFLGIDSSIAPLYEEGGLTNKKSSLINFIRKLGLSFSQSVMTDTYLRITNYLKEHNPKPIGLCGLMFPCLEDLGLAEEYEKGNFTVERNIYLSLHSGLGVDTYPIGINEEPDKILRILLLLQGLSNKYKKPLSARFVSDGKTKIGEMTDFKNQYLKDVTIRKL